MCCGNGHSRRGVRGLSVEVIGEDGGRFSDLLVTVKFRERYRSGSVARLITHFECAGKTNGTRALASILALFVLARLIAHETGDRIFARLRVGRNVEGKLPRDGSIVIQQRAKELRVLC